MMFMVGNTMHIGPVLKKLCQDDKLQLYPISKDEWLKLFTHSLYNPEERVENKDIKDQSKADDLTMTERDGRIQIFRGRNGRGLKAQTVKMKRKWGLQVENLIHNELRLTEEFRNSERRSPQTSGIHFPNGNEKIKLSD
jgi:hypothetical protein